MGKYKLKMVKQVVCLLCTAALLIFALPVMATADVTLESLWVSGSAVIDFDPNVEEYTLQVPYTKQADGSWSLEFPDVYATPSDRTATVTTTESSNAITVTVTAADLSVSKDYTLNITGVGNNLYVDGSFEDGTNFASNYINQYAAGATVTQTNEDAVYGDYAMKINYNGVNHRWSLKQTGDTFDLAGGRTYYSSMQAKLASEASETSYTNSKGINVTAAERKNYTADGTPTDSASVTLNKTDWSTSVAVLAPSSTVTNFTHSLLSWLNNDPVTLIDDCYLGDLVVSNVAIFDSGNNTVSKITMPTEGTSTIQLVAKVQNQFGTSAGLENETDYSWRLIGSPAGVSVSESGLLTVDTTAEINSTIYVECVLTPSFTGHVQTKAKGVAAVKICDITAADLTSITLDGKPLANFTPEQKNYTTNFLAIGLTGNVAEDLPEVVAVPKNDNVDVDIDYPSTLDGGIITITVTSQDNIESIYQIILNLVGHNLYGNGDFETGISGWNAAGATLSVTTQNPGQGSQSMLIEGSNAGRNWYENVTLEAGKKYIASCMVRLKDSGTYQLQNYFAFEGTKAYYNPVTEKLLDNANVMLTQDWQTTLAVLSDIPSTTALKHYFTYWSADDPALVVDDYYIAELLIAGINYTGESTVTIPDNVSEVNSINLYAKLSNQLGNAVGLENERVSWSLKEDYQGVSIVDNKLMVDGSAYAGTITLVATCAPNFSDIPTVEEFPITLVTKAGADLRPRADNVTISGVVEAGLPLTADYDFYQVNQEPSLGTVTQWQIGSSMNGPFTDIDNETGMTLIVDPAWVNSYIRFAVTPATAAHTGDTSYSNVLTKPTAPIATNVKISGAGAIGNIFTGSYDYVDLNGDEEGATTVRWSISDRINGTFVPIENETSNTYEIRSTDVNKYVRFEVTPKSTVAPIGEDDVFFSSPAMLCATTPVVDEITIQKVSNGVYSVLYQYRHPLSISEGESIISWTVDGRTAGNNTSVSVSTGESHEISVTVTPKASLPPYEGTPKTATMSITVSDKTVGVSHGGGGVSIAPKPKDEPTVSPKPEAGKHWASEAIKFVKEKGFMSNTESGVFEEDLSITRASFIHSVMLALNVEPMSYEGEFNDVAASDYFAGYLQKAVDMGIISHDTAFYPNRNLSRQEACKILVIAMDLANGEGTDLSVYNDCVDVSEWAKGYVSKAVNAKILTGVATDTFLPLGNVSRAQTATIIKRLYEFKNGGEVK